MTDLKPQSIEETSIFDILETLLRGWKLMAVFLAVGLAAAWFWFPGGPAPGLVKSTLEVVWSPRDIPYSFTVQIPVGLTLSAGLDQSLDAEESVKVSAMWSSANLIPLPNPLQTLWASFKADPAGSGEKNLALKSLRQESVDPAKLIWTCQTTNQVAGLEALDALNELADHFELYILAELKRSNNNLRASYEIALAAAEKALAGQEAALASLRADSLKKSAGGQDGKRQMADEAENRSDLPDWRNREKDLLMDIAFQAAQKVKYHFWLNQLAEAEASPVLRRTSSLVTLSTESSRPILVKAAGLVFLALILGCGSVFAADGWRRHRDRRRAQTGQGGLNG